MRKLLFLAFFIGASTVLTAQDTYYILAVKGKILNRNTSKYLKARQKIKSNDKVIFKDKKAKALVYSRGKGRFNLTLSPQNKKSPDELILLVKKSIFAQQSGAFTRAVDIVSLVNLREHFEKGTPKYVILNNRLELDFKPSVMTQIGGLGDGLFFIRYQYDGKTRNVGLALKDHKLVITKESLFKTKEGEWLDQNKASGMYIAYYQKNEKNVVQLGENEQKLAFNPFFLSRNDLEETGAYELVNILKKEKTSDKKIINEVMGLLAEFGVAEKDNVTAWYKKNFK